MKRFLALICGAFALFFLPLFGCSMMRRFGVRVWFEAEVHARDLASLRTSGACIIPEWIGAMMMAAAFVLLLVAASLYTRSLPKVNEQ